MTKTIFAANWKMHMGPGEARAFMDAFLAGYAKTDDREVWFFPPAVSVGVVAAAISERTDLRVGAQDAHWEPNGAFTGALSIPLVREVGATACLVGHSERRHVFGETDEETGKKVAALLSSALTPILCVGETLDQREAGHTLEVVRRQLAGALDGLEPDAVSKVVVAYEPVWAIGTGRTATPADAQAVHGEILQWLQAHGHGAPQILYGGSVKPDNAAALLGEPDVGGVLVGGASLKPESWLAIARTELERIA